MDKQYWTAYYKKNFRPTNPSPFCEFALEYIEENKSLIELGCGNGRDSLHFNKNGIIVSGVDQVDTEIDYLNKSYGNEQLTFIADDFTNIKKITTGFDYIYSRFTLHSVTQEEELNTLKWASEHLNTNGLLILELRSTKDPLYQEGSDVPGESKAKITDHYRRFADFEELKKNICSFGFEITYEIECNGLAVYKTEDPVVIRIIAKIK